MFALYRRIMGIPTPQDWRCGNNAVNKPLLLTSSHVFLASAKPRVKRFGSNVVHANVVLSSHPVSMQSTCLNVWWRPINCQRQTGETFPFEVMNTSRDGKATGKARQGNTYSTRAGRYLSEVVRNCKCNGGKLSTLSCGRR